MSCTHNANFHPGASLNDIRPKPAAKIPTVAGGRVGRSTALPERLRLSIQDQQERSEVLISVIQLVIVAIFGLLYAVAPKTFSQDADFAPVPWVLSLYLGFSLIRLHLALRRQKAA